jgi:hypothetical protein
MSLISRFVFLSPSLMFEGEGKEPTFTVEFLKGFTRIGSSLAGNIRLGFRATRLGDFSPIRLLFVGSVKK